MLDQRPRSDPGQHRRSPRLLICGTVATAAVAVAAIFAAVPALIDVPARLVSGCATWIALGGTLELLSALGFVVIFKLVFGAGLNWRQSWPAGLRALGASTVLPAGGLVGPAAGAWSADTENASASGLTRSVIAFVALTNAPGLIVLAGLGTALWFGWPSGPHDAALTLLPAGLALAVLAAAWLTRRSDAAGIVAMLRDGVAEARGLASAGNWKLLGAVGYYAFDNALLWAAFRAYGRTPPLSVIVMGYLIGSLASALPSPAGLGAVEGGLIGALVLYGAPAAPAAVAVLLYRSISLGVPVILGAIAWAAGPVAWLRTRPSVTRGSAHGAFAPPPTPELTAARLD
jgi:uncharacterized membrane protein YbhN (UPF0104 family)